jgi:diguanylate cyclase (GGDEF)-like protein/PAS domain S-box-containing protein
MLLSNIQIALSSQPHVLSASDGIEALLGFKPEDFLSSRVSLQELIHPHDADIAALLFSSEIDRPAGAFNVRLRHADGRIRCIKGHCTKNVAPGGEVILDLLLQDAKSLWKRPTRQIEAVNFRAMMENTDDLIFFKDRNHVFTGASRNMMTALNPARACSCLLGLTDYDIFPEEFADKYYRLEKQVFAGMDVASEIQRSQAIDGTRRWVDNRKYPIRGDKGEIVGLFGIVRDIAEQVEAENALRQSEASLAAAQARAHMGSWELDLKAMTGHWSAETARLHYRDPVQATLGFAEFLERVHPEDRAKCQDALCRIQEADTPFEFEYRTNPAFGPVRELGTTGYTIRDAAGYAIRIEGTTLDVTRRKLAEAALRESRELLQLFIEHAPAGLAMLDREMRYMAVSRRWLEIHSLVGQEVVGRLHYDILPEVPESWRELHRHALSGESVPRGEDVLVRANGSKQWIRREILPWYAGDGAIGGIVIFSEDITEERRAEAALRESKELLQLFIEHAPASLAMFDREMRYLAASRRWMEENQLGPEIVGRCHYDIAPDIPERWKEAYRRGLAGETLHADQDRFVRANGAVQWVQWEVRPWRTGNGAVGGIVLFVADITQKMEAEERLRLAASVFTHAREAILIASVDGVILDVNDTFTLITGYRRDEVVGQNPRLLSSGLHGKEFYAEMWRALTEKGQWSGEIWNRKKTGEIFAEMLTISAVKDAAGNARQFVALFSDITLLKEHERQLEHIAHYDVLTSLPNRVLLGDRLHQAMVQSHRRKQLLAVAYLDLDGFKAVNDRYGHDVGDLFLAALASRMKQALREGDTLARLGGDEFVAVLLDLEDADASVPVLARLLEAAAEPTQVRDLVLQVSASVGVTFYPEAEEVDADQLLRQADQAMYEAKLAGKGCYHIFDPRQDRNVRGHHENLAHIRQALAARQFVLYYQPKVNMRTGAVVGAEALIRWQHPERGLLPPMVFLPVIEDHPLAIELGEWVIDSALAQMERWHLSGLEIPVSVNVGALQLQQANFVERLRALLAAHPLVKPFSLELEVLETSALEDMAKVSQIFKACAELGVSFALDDFGTGYSSLTYLKRLPANLLKIDQSFVRDMLDDPEDLTILEGVLGLAGAFRRQVIAEGVETLDQGLMLLLLGCEMAQGYVIARPMPAADLPAWAASWSPDPYWSNVSPMSRQDLPLLYASVEHRAWVAAVEACLRGVAQNQPPMDRNACRLGEWLNAERPAARGSLPAFQAMETTHIEIHALAAEILDLHAQGRNPEALARLDELHDLRNASLNQLRDFTQSL